MPVGLLIAMAPKEPTSHGLTPRAAKLVWGSVGASTAPLLLCAVLLASLGWVFCCTREARDGTESFGTKGSSSSSSIGDILLRFREARESRESESEPEASPVNSASEDEGSDESEASSEGCLGGRGLAWVFCAAMRNWEWWSWLNLPIF